MSDDLRQRYGAARIDALTGGMVIECYYDRIEDAQAHAARLERGTVIVGSGCRGPCADHAEPVRRST